MRNKAPLAMMELSIMLLVFALCAVACLRCFLWADRQSALSAARDEALLRAQCAAELLKDNRGDFSACAQRYGGEWDDEAWVIRYNGSWAQTDTDHTYTLRCTRQDSGHPLLGLARVEVFSGGESLVRLEPAWQEVTGHG